MVSKCKESITNGCPLNHKLLSGTPELLELRTAGAPDFWSSRLPVLRTSGAPDCRCSRLLEHQANVYLDLHFIGLCHMGRNKETGHHHHNASSSTSSGATTTML